MLDGVYPVRDATAEGLDIMPGSVRGPVTDAAFGAALDPLTQIGTILAGLTVALDPNFATGFQLDQAGQRVGEPRNGFDDPLYRRIVLGRVSAMQSGGAYAGITATWRALADNPTTWSVRRLLIAGSPCIACFAVVDELPDSVWLARAASVLRDSVAIGVEVYGVLSLENGFELGSSGSGSGLDDGSLSALVQATGV
jgi:hypothetical protein